MRVLAIVAHPDDMEFYCAGTLLKCKARGDEVFVCNVSSGNLGHVVIPSDELKEIRRKEAVNSCNMVGFTHIYAGLDDCHVFESDEVVAKLVDIIKTVDPDFIITHSPNDYMADHTNVSKLVFDASFSASVPQYPVQKGVAAKNVPLYYMDNDLAINFEPSTYVDISEYIGVKRKMIECHESQLVWLKEHDGIDYAEAGMVVSRLRGLQAGVEYAEGFKECKASGKLRAERLLP